MNETQHEWGKSDRILSANDYALGTKVVVAPHAFLGRKEYESADGSKQEGYAYAVRSDDGRTKEFRITLKNERILRLRFGIKSPEEVVGVELTLNVVPYTRGNGFVVIDLKRPAAQNKQEPKPAAPAPAQAQEFKISDAQIGAVNKIVASDPAAADYVAYFLQRIGVKDLYGLDKVQGSGLIGSIASLKNGKPVAPAYKADQGFLAWLAGQKRVIA
jgi:hypothetical protein